MALATTGLPLLTLGLALLFISIVPHAEGRSVHGATVLRSGQGSRSFRCTEAHRLLQWGGPCDTNLMRFLSQHQYALA